MSQSEDLVSMNHIFKGDSDGELKGSLILFLIGNNCFM